MELPLPDPCWMASPVSSQQQAVMVTPVSLGQCWWLQLPAGKPGHEGFPQEPSQGSAWCSTLPFRPPESRPVPFAEAGSKSLQPTPVNLLIGACCGFHHNLILWKESRNCLPPLLFPRTGLLPTLLLIASEDLQDSQRQERFYVHLNKTLHPSSPSVLPCSSACFPIFSSFSWFFQRKARTVSALIYVHKEMLMVSGTHVLQTFSCAKEPPWLFSSKGTLWYLKEESVNVLDKI